MDSGGKSGGRKVKYSLLFWPSLYSTRTLFTLPVIFIALAGLAALVLHIGRQNERQLTTRAGERAKAVVALKLSGIETWQWKRELACDNRGTDCLKVHLAFSAPANTNSYAEKIPVAAACKICHTKESETAGSFYVSFTTIPAAVQSRLGEWLAFSLIAVALAALLTYLIFLRMRRRKSGLCIAAFEHDAAADKPVRNFLKRLAESGRLSYYGEQNGHRLRIATTPEKFRSILEANRDFLETNRGSLRFTALHIDLAQHGLLPIDVLRSVFQFLARTPARTYLLQEKLAVNLGPNYESERRLVFKSKSGALVKFVPWESQ